VFTKNKIAFLPVVVLLLSVTHVYSQQYETVIKIQAMDMARALLAKDLNKLVGYMPPQLVAEAGGIDKLMVARDTLNKYMKQFGAEIKKVTIGNPGKVISWKNQLQATVPQTTEMKVMASTVTFESTLIAISEDKGKHWYFVDTSIYRGDKLKSSLPGLSPELVIPPVKPPKIVADQ
jgi:hypothetical protein